MKKFFSISIIITLLPILIFISCDGDDGGTGPSDDNSADIIGTWKGGSGDPSYGYESNTYTFNSDGTYSNFRQQYNTNGVNVWNSIKSGTYSYNNNLLKLEQTLDIDTNSTWSNTNAESSWGKAFISGSSMYMGHDGNLMELVSGTLIQDGCIVSMYMYETDEDNGTNTGSSNYTELLLDGTNLIFTNIEAKVMENDVWTATNAIFDGMVTNGSIMPVVTNDGSVLGAYFGPDLSWVGAVSANWLNTLETNDLTTASKYTKQ
ncbi:MAG TPA: hypothetical protein VKS21_09990 [Spirochaetota bacterium]|nr:hypothetical protein [Spirochaetota bacterium]